MGQLDEAIRAHLELKRKHGASEEELKAEEQEALGPVRRVPPAVPDEDPELSEELDVDHEVYDEPPLAEPEAYDEPLEELPPETFHERIDPLAEPGFDEPVEVAEGPETVEFSEGSFEVAPEADLLDPLPPAAPEPVSPEAGDTPPSGFDAVEEPVPEDEEDVLEETPDFLQETPEHDRLWFEQKPPRDFDFDE